MKIFNIFNILPLYKMYSGEIQQPNSTEIIKSCNIEEIDVPIESYIDNAEPDFVMKNIKHGQIAEDYVEKYMLQNFYNCEKVSAREGFDFKVIIKDNPLYIEVKSIQNLNSPFHITINEINHAQKYENNYYICFVILPSEEKGVQEIKFIQNPFLNLGFVIPNQKYKGVNDLCTIIPEKFLIHPRKGFIKDLPDSLL